MKRLDILSRTGMIEKSLTVRTVNFSKSIQEFNKNYFIDLNPGGIVPASSWTKGGDALEGKIEGDRILLSAETFSNLNETRKGSAERRIK